jgi:hypothetical protein
MDMLPESEAVLGRGTLLSEHGLDLRELGARGGRVRRSATWRSYERATCALTARQTDASQRGESSRRGREMIIILTGASWRKKGKLQRRGDESWTELIPSACSVSVRMNGRVAGWNEGGTHG